MPFERHVLSAFGRFLLAPFLCSHILTKQERDCLLYLVVACYRRCVAPPVFRFEMETIFSYKARAFIEDAQYGLWTVPMTERALRVMAALLYDV